MNEKEREHGKNNWIAENYSLPSLSSNSILSALKYFHIGGFYLHSPYINYPKFWHTNFGHWISEKVGKMSLAK